MSEGFVSCPSELVPGIIGVRGANIKFLCTSVGQRCFVQWNKEEGRFTVKAATQVVVDKCVALLEKSKNYHERRLKTLNNPPAAGEGHDGNGESPPVGGGMQETYSVDFSDTASVATMLTELTEEEEEESGALMLLRDLLLTYSTDKESDFINMRTLHRQMIQQQPQHWTDKHSRQDIIESAIQQRYLEAASGDLQHPAYKIVIVSSRQYATPPVSPPVAGEGFTIPPPPATALSASAHEFFPQQQVEAVVNAPQVPEELTSEQAPTQAATTPPKASEGNQPAQKKKHRQTPSPPAQYVNQGLPILPAAPVQYPTGLIIVVDTCTLHKMDLDKLNELVKTNRLVIPAAVVNELDDQNKREGPLRVKAFQLRNWFAEMQCAPVGSVQRSNVRFQSSQGGDTLEVVDDKKPDDRILGCALFFRRSAVAEGKDCVIGTDDNFMAVKGRGGESMAVFKAWQLCHWNDTLQEQVAEAREEHARVEAENRFTEEKLAAEEEKRKIMLRQVAKARSMIAEGQALLNSLLPQWKCVQCQDSNNPSNTHCEKCNFNHGPM